MLVDELGNGDVAVSDANFCFILRLLYSGKRNAVFHWFFAERGDACAEQIARSRRRFSATHLASVPLEQTEFLSVEDLVHLLDSPHTVAYAKLRMADCPLRTRRYALDLMLRCSQSFVYWKFIIFGV